jgi:hypothetical protein
VSLGQPTPPSPTTSTNEALGAASSALTGINIPAAEAAQAGSNYNQVGPYGSLTYQQIGTGPNGVPIYGTSESLSGAQQGLLNTLQGTQQSAGTGAGGLIGGANYGATSPTQVIGDLASGLTGQNMSAYLASADPFFTTQSQQLDTQLRNQGLAPGNPAYDNAMRQLQTNQGYSVYGAAAAFEPQAFQQATTEYTLPATLGEQLAGFGAPATNQLGSTMQGGAALNVQTPNAASFLGPEVQAAQNQYQAQQAQYNAMINGLMGIGSGFLGAFA